MAINKNAYKNIDWKNVDASTISTLESYPEAKRNAILDFANSTDDMKSLRTDYIDKGIMYDLTDDEFYNIGVSNKKPLIQDYNTINKTNKYVENSEYNQNFINSMVQQHSTTEALEQKEIVDRAPLVEPNIDADAVKASEINAEALTTETVGNAETGPDTVTEVAKPTETATATNTEKKEADDIKQAVVIRSKANTGTEHRDEVLQRNILNDTINLNVKQHILGQDVTGHMHKHYYSTFKHVDLTKLVGFRRAHIFMTTPNCNIFIDGAPDFYNPGNSGIVSRTRDEWVKLLTPEIRKSDDLVNAIVDGNIDVAMYLDGKTRFNGRRNVWNFPLMNNVRSLSGLPNFDLKTRQGPNNFLNNYTEMVVNSAESISGNTVNITFNDDKDCFVARMMYIWTLYAEAVGTGLVSGRNANNKEIDYMCTIYAFVTDETNRKLKYWFSFVGCFPKSRSYDHLSMNVPSMKDRSSITTPFKLTIPVDMHPSILAMFNQISVLQEEADKKELLNGGGSDYNYMSANSPGVSLQSDGLNANQSNYFSDMFFISSERPKLDKNTGKYIFTKDSSQKATDEFGRYSYYLMCANRSTKMIGIPVEGGTRLADVTSASKTKSRSDIKAALLESAKDVIIIEGNPDNINKQIISSDLGVVIKDTTKSYTTFYDATREYTYNIK